MIILALKPGHDGHISCVENRVLRYSYEAEKDSRPRYAPVGAELLIDSFSATDGIPDVIALSGWAA
ncbi:MULTISPECIES: hypothetical protein [Paraburkholderia]|uniref:hypothetical protein n=1 Tax=Paraburkholderia TaxID=1822464 RepID=UPI0038BA54D8